MKFLKKSGIVIVLMVLSLIVWNKINCGELEKSVGKEVIGKELAGFRAERYDIHPGKSEEASAGVKEDGEDIFPMNDVLSLADVQQMAAGSILEESRLSQELIEKLFYSELPDSDLQQRVTGVSYQENDTIALEELRYLRVLHMGFDGETHIGELLVNQSIAEDVLEIMSELYKNEYPIEKMILVDEYGAEDELSMSDNNTSAFNYRQIAGSSRLSKHSLGLAIDINPKFNPYVKSLENGEVVISPANAGEYADRSRAFAYKIDEHDLCYLLFTERGFIWGGDWNSVKDYQHFEMP